MKLSERMRAMRGSGDVGRRWDGDVEALEADLADANARAMELTARCDRFRSERDALQRHYDAASPEHNLLALLDLYDDRRIEAERLRDHWRAHASGVSKRHQDSRAMHRRAQAAESRTIKAEREAATLRVRLAGAIAKIPPGDLWRMPDPVVDARPVPTLPEFMRKSLAVMATIPPVALEATSGGARGLDAAERPYTHPTATFLGVPLVIDPTLPPGTMRVDGRVVDMPVPDEDLVRRRATERVGGRETPMWNGKCEGVVAGSSPLDVCARQADAIAERDARIATLERINATLTRDRAAVVAEGLRNYDEAIARAERAEAQCDTMSSANRRMWAQLRRVRDLVDSPPPSGFVACSFLAAILDEGKV